jgi:APA family basic amino acid/polyamine antiporter
LAELNKNLGSFTVFCLAAGAMISSGLFILPGLAHAMAGPAVVFSYFLAGCLAATGMLSVAEIMTAMPKAGGDYFFINRTMGPAAGAVTGLLSWFSLSLKSSFALIGMGAFASSLLGVNPLIPAVVLLAIFVAINLLGAEHAGRLQVFLVLTLFGLMTYFIIVGAPKINWAYFEPFAPNGIAAVLATSGVVFVSYGGLLKIASVAEEIRNPGKTIPLAMIAALLLVGVFYVAMVFITSGVLGARELDQSLTPISDAAMAISGPIGANIMSLAAAAAFASTAAAGIMAASRYLLALSRDDLVPGALSRLHPKFKTPQTAVLTTGVFILGSLFLELEVLVKAASTVLILTYLMANICVIVLRESKLMNYRPSFRSPGYPWLQIAGSIGFVVLVLEMGWQALVISMLLILSGLGFYWFYGRIRAQREYALLHLVERMTDTELVGGILEEELRAIIRDRDQMCWDEFDHAVGRASIIDLKDVSEPDEVVARTALGAGGDFGIEPETLARALKTRQQQSSTEMLPGVAVSDSLIPGENRLEFILVRIQSGISLSQGQNPTWAFFVILFSSDCKDSYLRSLAAIAQVAGGGGFARDWRRASGKERLRDVVLTAPRQRICNL